ncbi:hypothetical protein GCM10017608_26860 [Agromyces luteolus]|uniref:cell wall-binding repeat-containing protein n=1 Tax=Agromyces luteolus TaxID=88373 RepID=UPI001412F847|nr:cell wall-binding repeat-containing protein [Agromyces luteolus]GLK28751.1 hypothetical protein GCM10017608_26860 [Agromyces luteolus]
MKRPLPVLLAALLSAVLLAPGAISPADPAVAVAGTTVSGYVYEQRPSGTYPASNASVNLFPSNGGSHGPGTASTDSSGRFVFSGVAPGTYRVHARPAYRAGLSYDIADVYLPGTPFARDAQVISVGSSSVSLPTVTLPLGGRMQGVVSLTDGADLAASRTQVTVKQYNGETGAFEGSVGSSVPIWNGAWQALMLPAGTYLVYAGTENATHRGEFWPDAPEIDGAELVQVTAGETTVVDFALDPAPRTVTRLAGPDRYTASAAISSASFSPGVPVAYVANGDKFPDALSAGALAGVQGGPVLLTRATSLPGAIASELARLKPERIIVVGGPVSVSDGVLATVRKYSSVVSRIGGPDRFAVSRSAVRDVYLPGGADTVFIATGYNFPDALSAGSAAAANSAPMVLVPGSSGGLDAATKQLLSELKPSRIVIAGGTATVSTGIEADLRRQPGVRLVERMAGANRYETSWMVGALAPADDVVYLTTGEKFPDALSGSAVAGDRLARVLLVQPNCIPSATLDQLLWAAPSRIVILGGTASVGTGVAQLRRC